MALHPEILTPVQREMAASLGTVASRFGYYLAGGTAIALHLGHRRSEDFDWFVPAPAPGSPVIVSAIEQTGLRFEVDDLSTGTLMGRIQGVKVSFFEYPYPLIEPTFNWEEAHAGIASLRDLGAMKLLAIAQRGSRKDFVDVFELLRAGHDLKTMLIDFQTKFGVTETISVKRGLVYCDDAELEPMPEVLVAMDWNDVKELIAQVVQQALER